MAKRKPKNFRERLILALGGALRRNRKKPAPENKALSVPENKSFVRGEG